MWSIWASGAATVVVVAAVAWHSRQTHRPGSSRAALEVIFQVLVAGGFAFTYWRLRRSPSWRVVQGGPQGVRADTLAVFAATISLTGLATAGCAIWFWVVTWASSANAALLSVLAVLQLCLAGQMFRDVRRSRRHRAR